jgi:hypothetical protein
MSFLLLKIALASRRLTAHTDNWATPATVAPSPFGRQHRKQLGNLLSHANSIPRRRAAGKSATPGWWSPLLTRTRAAGRWVPPTNRPPVDLHDGIHFLSSSIPFGTPLRLWLKDDRQKNSPEQKTADAAVRRDFSSRMAEQYPIELFGHALKIHRAKLDPSDHGAA